MAIKESLDMADRQVLRHRTRIEQLEARIEELMICVRILVITYIASGMVLFILF